MTQTTPHMTPDQIRARLKAIIAEQARHAARDLDAELAKVISEGGDVDAVETAHIEAERASRRLRVERASLEADLPVAERRHAAVQIVTLAEQHSALSTEADAAAAAIIASWSGLVEAIGKWRDIQNEAEGITRSAAGLVEKFGAEMPSGLGYFNSSDLVAVAKDWRNRAEELVHGISSAERAIDTGIGDLTARFARTTLPVATNDNEALAVGQR